jgi:hypothetical protein
LVCSCFFKLSSFFFLHSSSPTWPAWPTTPDRDLLHQLALSLSWIDNSQTICHSATKLILSSVWGFVDSTTCIVVIVVEQQCCKWEGKDRGKQTDQEQKKANDHSQIDY